MSNLLLNHRTKPNKLIVIYKPGAGNGVYNHTVSNTEQTATWFQSEAKSKQKPTMIYYVTKDHIVMYCIQCCFKLKIALFPSGIANCFKYVTNKPYKSFIYRQSQLFF